MTKFKTGRVLWNGREFIITEVEQITASLITLHTKSGKMYNAKILERDGAKMIEFIDFAGQKKEERRKKRRDKKLKMAEGQWEVLKNASKLKEYEATVDGINELELDILKGDIQEDDYVLRTMNGDGKLIVYNNEFGQVSDNVNEVKDLYSVIADVDYLDARPIYVHNWLELPEQRKLASKLDTEEKQKT